MYQKVKKVAIRLASSLSVSLRRMPLFWAAIAAVVGISVADLSEHLVKIPQIIFLLATIYLLHRRHVCRVAFCGLYLTLVTYSVLHTDSLDESNRFPLRSMMEAGKEVEAEVEAVLVSEPVFRSSSASVIMEVSHIQRGDLAQYARHRVPTRIRNAPDSLRYGDKIRVSGVFSSLEGAQVPGGFDAREFYFRESGSLARFEIGAGGDLRVDGGFYGSRLVSFAIQSRKALDAALRTGLSREDEPYARLIAAMAFGARENSPEDLEEWFRLSGTTHLFAVSGMHVGIVGGIIVGLFVLLRVPRRYAVWLAIPLILFYAVLTGLRPSALRAAIMLCAFLAAYGLREKPAPLNALGFAALILLFFDTQELFLPGFQLSFTVLLFLLLFAKLLGRALQQPFRSDPFIPVSLLTDMQHWQNRIVFVVASALAISVTSWIGSAGWLTWHFQSLAPVGVIANLIMVPFAGIIISLAFLSSFLVGIKLAWLGGLCNQLNVGVAIILTSMAQFFAEFPGANLNVGTGRDSAEGMASQDTSPVRVDLLGKFGGESALITVSGETGAPQYWLVDGGDETHYQSLLLPLLRTRGINRLDAVIITHGDRKHVGALPRILRQFRPGLVLESSAENRSSVYPDIVATMDELKLRSEKILAGKVIRLAEQVQIEILAPEFAEVGRIADDKALVFKLVVGGSSVLFSSDSGFAAEKDLLERGVDLRSDVWVRGQHSESPSGLAAFLDSVQPESVVSSDAEFPPGERLSISLVESLQAREIEVFRLGESGLVSIFLSEMEVRVAPFRK